MKIFYLIILSVFVITCSSTATKLNPISDASLITLQGSLIEQSKQIDKIEEELSVYKKLIDEQSHVIEYYKNNSNEIDKYKEEINIQVQNALGILQESANEQELLNSLNKIQTKIQILEDRTFYTDSLYFEIINEVVMLENKTVALVASFKEVNELSGRNTKKIIPRITDEEFTTKYIESLSHYQNGEWNLSLDGFRYLIQADNNHDLADNSQYWIGEIYYALNDYRSSINEFEKVFTFPGTNKSDDAQYKLGLCYVNIGQMDNAKKEFKNLIEFYPSSEYIKKAKNYLNSY